MLQRRAPHVTAQHQRQVAGGDQLAVEGRPRHSGGNPVGPEGRFGRLGGPGHLQVCI